MGINSHCNLRDIYIYRQTDRQTDLFCFVLQHINIIGHLMPNQVNENKSEKKLKREVLGINDKL